MSRFVVTATWDNNAPHLSETAKRERLESMEDYQKDARTKGIPQLGSGVIYPISDDEIMVDAFTFPPHFLFGFGLDVGWKRVACEWRAKDPDTGVSYQYDEYYGAEQGIEIHAAAIRKRGLWIPGKIDPAARGRAQKDGERLVTDYRKAIWGEEDLNIGNQMMTFAFNGVESGIREVLSGLRTGTFKVFKNRCPNWTAERRLYRRDEHGMVVKAFDHAMDASRYNIASGDDWLRQRPIVKKPGPKDPMAEFGSGGSSSDTLSWQRT